MAGSEETRLPASPPVGRLAAPARQAARQPASPLASPLPGAQQRRAGKARGKATRFPARLSTAFRTARVYISAGKRAGSAGKASSEASRFPARLPTTFSTARVPGSSGKAAERCLAAPARFPARLPTVFRAARLPSSASIGPGRRAARWPAFLLASQLPCLSGRLAVPARTLEDLEEMDALEPPLYGQIRAEEGSGDLEETNKLPSHETVELKDSSVQSRQSPEKAVAIQEYHHESDEVMALVHLQAKKTCIVNEEAFSQSQKPTTHQRYQHEKMLLCDQCGKEFWYPSNFSQHQCVYSRQKAVKQTQPPSEPSEPHIPSSLEPALENVEDRLTNCSKGSSQNSEVMTDQRTYCRRLYLCDQCGKAFQYLSDLACHQGVHSRKKATKQDQSKSEADSPSLLEPTPVVLQMESMSMNSKSAKTMIGQSTHRKKLHFCDQRGKDWWRPWELAQHQRVHSRQRLRKQGQSRSKADTPSQALQVENMSINSRKALSQNSKVMSNQSTHCRRRYLCDQCGKDFRDFSDLARHQRVHSRQNAAKQGRSPPKVDSSALVEPTPLALRMENTFTSNGLSQNSQVTTDQISHRRKLHICDHCGKVFKYRSVLAQHLRVHSRQNVAKRGQSPSEVDNPYLVEPTPLALQMENAFTNTSKGRSQISKVTTDQSSHCRKLYLCDHCGKDFRYPSDLARHQRVHSRQNAAKQGQSPPKVDSPPLVAPTPLALQMEITFTSKGRSQNSQVTTDQSSHCRKLYLCDHCGKDFRYPSDLARHQRVHSRQKAAKQGQSPPKVDSPPLVTPTLLALQMENTFTSNRLSQNSQVTTDQSSHCRKLHLCDHCGKGFWYPSHLARHQHVHSRQKAAKQGQSPPKVDSPTIVEPTPLALQMENTFTNTCNGLSQNSQVSTDQSSHSRKLHLCDHCGKVFKYRSVLAQHLRVHSRQKGTKHGQSQSERHSSTPSTPQEDSMNSNKILHKNTKVMTVQRIHPTKQHICKHCGKCFKWPSDLARHQCRVHKRFEWLAKEDDPNLLASAAIPLKAARTLTGYHKPFSHNSKLMTDQSPLTKQSYLCSKCGKKFLWLSHLTRHKRTHLRRKKIKQRESSSDKCSRPVPIPKLLQGENELANLSEAMNPSYLLMADQSTHTEKPYLCDQCGEGFSWSSELIQHEYTHLRERPYDCLTCGRQFKRHVQLVRHHKWHEESQEEGEEGESFQNMHWGNDPGEHVPMELPQDLPPEKNGELYKILASPAACECGACDTGTNDRSELLPGNNVWEIGLNGHPHLLSLPQACECGCCESNGEGGAEPPLQAEVTSNVMPVSVVSPCETITTVPAVPAASPGAPGHVAHMLEEEASTANMAINSVAPPPDLDSLDPEWLPSPRSRLRKQVRSSVQGAKPHSCPVCSKRFRLAEYLTKHLNVHRPGKPYHCIICGMRFGRRSYLLKHCKLHTVGSAHVCPYCGCIFSQRAYLRKHMHIHTGQEWSFPQDASPT
ncbi:zinc finger protein 729-like [Eublepharis macularius]|uniref:Zinc finger protein 729-like n=1 Tax=Eublepharis macularius TaxID=481883 RepID=A0AA97K4P9_EUBMA|nr:zinc finger protein 729-like [Eublepharis macularius]